MIRLKKILFPTDFSEFSLHALPYARRFAAAFHAKLYLLHVVEPMPVMADDLLAAASVLQLETEAEERGRARLHDLLDLTARATLEIEERVIRGVPFAEIVRVAREEEIDLIVLATHGLSGIAHLLIGSTAEKVVRKAPCAVLTVKSPQPELAGP
jgi:nucleotide-binding universal stress UspA family protein